MRENNHEKIKLKEFNDNSFFDISVLINENLVVFPGDPKPLIKTLETIPISDWTLSEITISAHVGTHVDAPKHVFENGKSIDNFNLTKFQGKAIVIDYTSLEYGNEISKQDLIDIECKLGIKLHNYEIILLKTRNSKNKNAFDSENFREDAVILSENAAEYIINNKDSLKETEVIKNEIKNKIKAIGIDYLSIGSLNTHKILLKTDLLIYENLNLSEISEGEYYFMGFPIKINTEAAPARCILISKLKSLK